jgi:hypothetical protein
MEEENVGETREKARGKRGIVREKGKKNKWERERER